MLNIIRQLKNNQAGYTIVELILSTAVLAFMAIVALPQDDNVMTPLSLDASARKIQSDIRYAQTLASTTGEDHGFQVTGASTYIIYNVDTGVTINSPLTGQAMLEDLNDDFEGVTFISPNYQVEFNDWGKPTTGAGSLIQITNGQASKTVQVTTESGYVYLM